MIKTSTNSEKESLKASSFPKIKLSAVLFIISVDTSERPSAPKSLPNPKAISFNCFVTISFGFLPKALKTLLPILLVTNSKTASEAPIVAEYPTVFKLRGKPSSCALAEASAADPANIEDIPIGPASACTIEGADPIAPDIALAAALPKLPDAISSPIPLSNSTKSLLNVFIFTCASLKYFSPSKANACKRTELGSPPPTIASLTAEGKSSSFFCSSSLKRISLAAAVLISFINLGILAS